MFGLVGAMLCVACSSCGGPETATRQGSPSRADHVGRAACAECHEVEAGLWQGSHHDLAMQPASAQTVLGDFDGAEFSYAGLTTTFSRRDGKFIVRTDGPDGRLQDYEVAYTFGVDPLQQYLIELPGGRLQALGICWDTRPATAGGQRWFHIYPQDAVAHEDALHWTASLQNWNYMCSECHSTGVRKNYLAADDEYDTTWSEIDVSCEACHGPGSRHVEWATQPARTTERTLPDKGLAVRLSDDEPASWVFDPAASSARRDPPRESRAQVEACARCHARRTQLTDDYRHGRPLADTHRVALLEEPLYHADGQILDEVYVYGSFRQSAMYHNGVTCTDCHDPHTARLRLDGNATCSGCHRQDVFDTSEHHFHEPGSSGASCVACHMPVRNYMVVDPRHDHGFRVPRPDLSVAIGTPNACTDCHTDRDADWAATVAGRWYGGDRQVRPHFAEAIHAGRTWQAEAGAGLLSVIEDLTAPAIVRATALTLLRSYPTPGALVGLREALADEDELVRQAATGMLELLDADARLQLGIPVLGDPIRGVRLEAARVLASVPRDRLTESQRAAIDLGLEEYREVQRFNGDRGESHLNLGWLHVQQGRMEQAEREYLTAMRLAPAFSPAAINLADLYRLQGRESEGETVLREAISRTPADADLQHALGLLLVRQKRSEAAIELFARAVELAPERPHYAYVLGVALHSTGKTARSLETLKRAHESHPGHTELLFMLAAVSRDVGDRDAAILYARRLLAIHPGHPGASGLIRELGG